MNLPMNLKILAFAALLVAAYAPNAAADTLLLSNQTLAAIGPVPTGGIYVGVALCNTFTPSCVSGGTSPLALFTSTGDSTFTSSDPGFQAFASYLSNPNPPPGITISYFFSYESGGTRLFIRQLDCSGCRLAHADPSITALKIHLDEIASFSTSQFGVWSARTATGQQSSWTLSLEGSNLVPEASSVELLVIGIIGIVWFVDKCTIRV